jgi:hypothetical protein
LLVYPKETVVAEKFEAIVQLGIANTRMKDFYDLAAICRTFTFEGTLLEEAIRKTFANRGTELPAKGIPLAFTPEFHDDQSKKTQWTAFCNRIPTDTNSTDLKSVVETLKLFLAPVAAAAREKTSFVKTWKPGGPWQ